VKIKSGENLSYIPIAKLKAGKCWKSGKMKLDSDGKNTSK
jgi:hypothetical protein